MSQIHETQRQYPQFNGQAYIQQPQTQQYQQSRSPAYSSAPPQDPRGIQQADPRYAAFQRAPSRNAYQASQLPPGSPLQPYSSGQTQVSSQIPLNQSPYAPHSPGPVQPQTRTPFSTGANPQQYAQYQQGRAPQPSYGSPAPASPTHTSPPRRPLPTPGSVQRPGSIPPERRPLPSTNASPAPSSYHRPSHSVSSVATSSGFSPNSNLPNGSRSISPVPPFSRLHAPRPLPEPMPRSARSLDLTRSPSPIKNVLDATGQLPPPGQKFVPLWKRALPQPGQPPAGPSSPSDKRSTISGPPAGFNPNAPPVSPTNLQRSRTGVRPLPSFPNQTQTGQERTTPSSSSNPPSAFSRAMSDQPGMSSSLPQIPSAYALRDRSRTLPEALPAPTAALPHRPNSILPPPRAPAISNASVEAIRSLTSHSSSGSESEDLHDNTLLRRPEPIPAAVQSVQRSPSPTYGIRDLPRRTNAMAETAHTSEGRQASLDDLLGKKEHAGGPRSIATRMAMLSMNGSPNTQMNTPQMRPNGSPPKRDHPMPIMERTYAQIGLNRWPNNLPPLPRAPLAQAPPPPNTNTEPQKPQNRSVQRDTSPVRPQPMQYSSRNSSPTRPQLPQPPQRDISPTRPAPPTRPSAFRTDSSPERSTFSSSSRHTSPVRSQPQRQYTLPSPPRDLPSPTRSRFPQYEPQRGRTLPDPVVAPQAHRVIPNLDDAPPLSLRRSPSPIRPSAFSSSSQSYALPTIRTQDVRNAPNSPSKLTSPPSARTPSSAGSVFSLSAFPAPPQVPQPPSWSVSRNGGWGTSSPSHRPDGAQGSRNEIPKISFPGDVDEEDEDEDDGMGPMISISGPDVSNENDFPMISISGTDEEATVRVSKRAAGNGAPDRPTIGIVSHEFYQPLPVLEVNGELPSCVGCGAIILGKSWNMFDGHWHLACMKCHVCQEPLADLAMFVRDGRPYCSLDYHEKFSPRCYHCQTGIVDEAFVTLNHPDLGKRTYHDHHFFCAECGDPFLEPGTKNRTFDGDGLFQGSGAPFTVYQGHPYCEKCHVRLRMPKCRKCKKSLRNDDTVVEALGGRWCFECFCCTQCNIPFSDGRLFLRDEKPFCYSCWDVMARNEI